MFSLGGLNFYSLFFFLIQVNDVVFSFDESHFATCSEDGSVRIWSTSSYELVVQFQVLNQVREYVSEKSQHLEALCEIMCSGGTFCQQIL